MRGDTEEVLARITSGRPAAPLRARFRAHAWERFFLFELDRLNERLLVHVAYAGARATESELDADWLLRQIDLVLDKLLDEDREEERKSPFDCDPEDRRYEFLRSLTVVGRFARAASLAFNILPDRARRGFYYLLMENRSVEECLALGIWEREELLRDILARPGSPGVP